MKKVLYVCILLALVACSKKSTPTPDKTIVYQFTGSTSATYHVMYAGPDTRHVDTTFTGTTWSKTITVNQATGFKNAVFFIGLTSPNTVITGNASILVDNQLSSQEPLQFDSGEGSTDLTFYAYVFK
ncbi:MAG: hypothetical protein ACHQHN_14430 [Sphingobacteriales bacterium]